MSNNVLAPTQPNKTSDSASHLPSVHDHGLLELVWENGQVLMREAPSSRTRKAPACTGCSLTPFNFNYGQSSDGDRDSHLIKRARLHVNISSQKDSHDRPIHSDPPACNTAHIPTSFITTRSVGPSQTLTQRVPIPDGHFEEKQGSAHDKRTGKAKFSHFLRPAFLVNSNIYHQKLATPRLEELGCGKDEEPTLGSGNALDSSTVIEPASGSAGTGGIQNQNKPELLDSKEEQVLAAVDGGDIRQKLLDEHSEALGENNPTGIQKSREDEYGQSSGIAAHEAKEKPDKELLLDASYSVCSLGASNDPTYTMWRNSKYEETEEHTSLSDNDEEPNQSPAQGSTRAKRIRNAEIRNLSQRKRRDKINKKMRMLRHLIPNCKRKDKASMLDEAIEYLKTLKFQLEVMSMGTAGLMPPPMMLPSNMQHMNAAQYLTHQLSLNPILGNGVGLRTGMGLHCCPAQFPLKVAGGQAAPSPSGITDNRLNMLGFPAQALSPGPISHAPLIPTYGNPFTQTVMVANAPSAKNHLEHMGFNRPPPLVTNMKDSIFPNNSDVNAD